MQKNNPIKIRKPTPNFCGEDYYHKDGFKKISLKDFQGKYLLIFFILLTLLLFALLRSLLFLTEPKKIGCEVVGISTDLKFSQMKYSKTPRDQGGLEKLNIMSISDIGKNISTSFGCLIDNETDEEYGVSFRETYIIDSKGILRHYSINGTPVGRNMDEYLSKDQQRDQFILTPHDEVFQKSWKPKEQGIKVSRELRNRILQVVVQ